MARTRHRSLIRRNGGNRRGGGSLVIETKAHANKKIIFLNNKKGDY